ncbi:MULTISPECIES: ATPase, T2SS/T4P/T4SS family [unclassified Burkholderia]|uniref:ATPase, T2SS/T4P/T4SS family n=1 Tax=unclassified Burkholderia TaxID=2613784 RepID=UPI002AAFCFA6|nr:MULTISPECIES: ATPase, T2SS/T4P/T4SS family [unclassified Burkholderia]
MDIRVKSESIAEARAFSDWRLYDADPEETCALPNQEQAGKGTLAPEVAREGVRPDMDRPWQEYGVLSMNLRRFADTLREHCKEESQHNPFAAFLLDIQDESSGHRAIRYRAQAMGGFYALKHIPLRPIPLDKLHGINVAAKKLALSSKLRTDGGLLLCVGDTGAGKSTGANAVVRERLLKYGGYCLTLADPLETPLGDDGGHRVGTNGYVDEVDVRSIGFTAALEHALRAFPIGAPGMLYYGEVRSNSNSVDLLNIACDGHEVITTVHGMTPDAAVTRLIATATRAGLAPEIAREQIAQSLRGVLFHSYAYGSWQIRAYEASDRILQGIRDGSPAPFRVAAAQQSGMAA